ncbi:hypothetical protein [Brevibacillus sp. H7]|uniref:hypothetical protein n=1 Tax=Brevibacillus sp. H7 TaxID=3349138 RepID=UPI0037F3BC14
MKEERLQQVPTVLQIQTQLPLSSLLVHLEDSSLARVRTQSQRRQLTWLDWM